MYKAEISKLNHFEMTDAMITLIITVASIAGAYFLDGARIAAFGVFPALGIFRYAELRGVTRHETPRLYWTLFVAALLLILAASYWALSHPKQ